MTKDEIIAFLDHRLRASRAHDVASLVAGYADDCVVESPVLGTVTGRGGVQAAFEKMFAAIPDWDMQIESRIVMGDQVVQTFTVSGTDHGGFFTRQPFAKPFQARGVLFLELQNNTILRERRLYDFSGILLQRVEEELKTAAQIQQALQPVGKYSGNGFDVAAVSMPCRQIGGDFFDYFHLPDAFGFVLGDVAGKGSPAALMASMLLGVFGEHAYRHGSPAEILGFVNQALVRRAIEARFATALCAMLTPDGRLTYSNAGHNHPFLVGKNGPPRRLCKSGTVLGVFGRAEFEEETVQLDPGDVVVVFSDGITEAFSAEREEFGDDRLISSVQAHRELEPQVLLEHILDMVRQFTAGAAQSDDLTGLVLRYTGNPSAHR